MNWLFTLLDRNNTLTDIDEPVGFDACRISIERNLEKHGVVFDFAGNDFQFYGTACRLIKAERDAYGVEAMMVLIISLSCSGDAPEELYRGRLFFPDYVYVCGDECYVSIPLETTGDALTFTNRFDQKVNLQTLKGFDEVTDLVPYSKLPFDMTLPSKAIELRNIAISEKNIATNVLGVEYIHIDAFSYNFEMGQVELAMAKTVAAEMGFVMNDSINYSTVKKGPGAFAPPFDQDPDVFQVPLPITATQDIYIWPKGSTAIVNWSEGITGFTGEPITPDLHVRVKGKINLLHAEANRIAGVIVKVDGDNIPTWLHVEEIYIDSPHLPIGTEIPFDFTYDNSGLVINPNDNIYCLISVGHFKEDADAIAELDAFSVEFDLLSYWRMKFLSITAPTISKMFMINEAISRVAETITDDKIRAYSEYFGRTDSQPYSVAEDGTGSLEAITKGLFIRRQENRIHDNPFLFNISMKDIWEGLNPIHNIGLGIEKDPNRPGFNRLRVERWKFFYKDDVILVCDNVSKVKRKTISSEHYSTFKFGYEKWEAEEYNGLDEFLTKRAYRTTLTQVKNELLQISKMIASGYAWEITRRKGDLDSKDWRYDNETFIACVKRFTRSYSHEFTGQFLVSSFFTNEEPTGLEPGDAIIITGSDSNDGEYIIDSISDLGGGDWGIYFTSAVITEADQTITIDLLNPGFIIETGNVLSPENIIDPATLYNYRISPIRNALRWMDKILASYKHLTADSKILFMDGDGNYFAKGEMESAFGKLENAVMAENATLDNTVFTNSGEATPALSPERIEYDHPVSLKEFKEIQSNPYGLIEWFNDCESGSGWIDNVDYKPEEGIASFLLIPKLN